MVCFRYFDKIERGVGSNVTALSERMKGQYLELLLLAEPCEGFYFIRRLFEK